MGPERGKVALGLVGLWALVAMGFWALALQPLDATAPEWLVRTRYVCFGALPGGLPDAAGWMTLVGGPLLLLVAVLVTFSSELRAGLAFLKGNAVVRGLALTLCCAFALEVGWAAVQVRDAMAANAQSFAADEAGRLPPAYPRLALPAPDFALIDQRGQPVSLASLRGKDVVLTFAFAHCATVCPALIMQTRTALSQLDPSRTRAVFITLDPWRDRPSTLPEMAQRWQLPPEAHLLSGEVAEVERALKAYEVPYVRDASTGDVQHPALVYVIDAEGRLAFKFNNPPSDWVVDAVTRLHEDGS